MYTRETRGDPVPDLSYRTFAESFCIRVNWQEGVAAVVRKEGALERAGEPWKGPPPGAVNVLCRCEVVAR